MNWLKVIILASFAALAPIHAVMAAAGILIVIDTVLGVLAARKRGDPITSAQLRRTISKMLIYQAAIISAFLVEHYLMGDILPIVKMCGGAIGLVEGKSVLENCDELNGNPIFASLIKRLGSANDKPPDDQPPEPPKAA